ncbi:MAG: FHA domain-containing protein [Myxococcales bacterium]|nr:FHA domain-containing protein [Myxococcales bacterium]
MWLRDSGSANGTFVDGQRVMEITLSPGITIQIDQSSVRLLAVYPAVAQAILVVQQSGVAPTQEAVAP